MISFCVCVCFARVFLAISPKRIPFAYENWNTSNRRERQKEIEEDTEKMSQNEHETSDNKFTRKQQIQLFIRTDY